MGTFNEFIKNHTYEVFAQDKWKIGQTHDARASALRYDLEIIPLDETDNPLFPAGDKNYPVDRNNFSPRIGFTHSLDDAGQVGGSRRLRHVLQPHHPRRHRRHDGVQAKYTIVERGATSRTTPPIPGRAPGRFPTDPFLVNGPVVNRALLEQMYPPGVPVEEQRRRDLRLARTARRRTRTRRRSVRARAERVDGGQRRLHPHGRTATCSWRGTSTRCVRVDTSRTGALIRVDAFGVLDEPYTQQVWVMENTGESDYDALNLSLEKRYSNNWSGRVSYSLSKSRGTAENQADKNTYQFLTDPNLDQLDAARASVDRRHVPVDQRADRDSRRPRASRCPRPSAT